MSHASASDDLRILQITDCHLYRDPQGTLAGVNTRDSLREVLDAAIPDPMAAPDAIVATGDLVHDCSEAGYRLLGETLAPLSPRSAVLPGNHDDPSIMERILPGYGLQVCGTLELGDWSLILLDSHLPGEAGGNLAAGELERLDQVLARSGKHVLIFVHHHPTPVGSPWIDRIGLSNGEALLQRVREHDEVKGVLWGHVHQEWQGHLNRAQLLAAPSTCIQFAPQRADFAVAGTPPGWRSLTLHGDGRFSTSVGYLDGLSPSLSMDSRGY